MLFVDVLAHVDDLVTPLFVEGLETPTLPFPAAMLRHASTAMLIVGWILTKRSSVGRRVLIAIETGVTITLTLVYVHVALAYVGEVLPSYGPTFSLVGIQLLLVVRASLVPSTAFRTGALGALALAIWMVVSRPTLDRVAPLVFDGLTFIGVAFIVSTIVTSHVIYGLRREVRRALRLGQYDLGRQLGKGGMGEVYEATHIMLRRPTAVKLLPPERAGEQTVARFEREVRETSRLEHPNTVSIYDYGRTPDGVFYYAMEYVDGLTLSQLVNRHGPVDVARARHLLRQAAEALAEAHRLGLVHRDIKPANIMICERAGIPDTVKVLDFGLVKEIENPDAERDITRGDVIVGTPHFLAPEAITSPDEVGPRSDVYALGAVGFFLVSGRDVFPGRSVIEVCSQHLSADPESLSSARGEAVDPGFEALIARCLAKAPPTRPADGGALAAELAGLELPAWTTAEARRWWDDHRDDDVASEPPPTPTHLAVDVEAR